MLKLKLNFDEEKEILEVEQTEFSGTVPGLTIEVMAVINQVYHFLKNNDEEAAEYLRKIIHEEMANPESDTLREPWAGELELVGMEAELEVGQEEPIND